MFHKPIPWSNTADKIPPESPTPLAIGTQMHRSPRRPAVSPEFFFGFVPKQIETHGHRMNSDEIMMDYWWTMLYDDL